MCSKWNDPLFSCLNLSCPQTNKESEKTYVRITDSVPRSMGSVDNCVTVIAKVSMKCSTKVNEIERHL